MFAFLFVFLFAFLIDGIECCFPCLWNDGQTSGQPQQKPALCGSSWSFPCVFPPSRLNPNRNPIHPGVEVMGSFRIERDGYALGKGR